MKTKYFMLLAAFILCSLFSFASSNTDSIKVWGNCSLCKTHIETAAKAAGATTANWSISTKILVVSYDDAKTSNMAIQKKIASAGYNTQDVKGSDAAYKKLDECCQYDRKKQIVNSTTAPGN